MSSQEDRKLLELAAKAAGIEHPAGEHCINGPALWDCKKLSWWRPLTDDGDALRLAIALKLSIEVSGNDDQFYEVCCGASWESFTLDGEDMPATRRAIVRAASEIGRSIP